MQQMSPQNDKDTGQQTWHKTFFLRIKTQLDIGIFSSSKSSRHYISYLYEWISYEYFCLIKYKNIKGALAYKFRGEIYHYKW